MKRALLAAILAGASVAAAASDIFGVHLVTSVDAPGARMWRLASPGGAVETISLDSAALLDASAIATAGAERSPDGGSQIRLVLTADGARRLAEFTSRNVGRRLGIVVDGQLRAAPVVSAGMTSGFLVVGGLKPTDAAVLARKLGSASVAGPDRVTDGSGLAMTAAPRDAVADAALRGLQGAWTTLNATVNGRVVPDPKFSGTTWIFHDGTLTLTNGHGQTERFALRTEASAPAALHLEPIAPSKERGGWMIFKREGERLIVALFDDPASRPTSFEPAPEKLVLTLSRNGRTETQTPCAMLVAAGVASFLPGGVHNPERERRGGGSACVFNDPLGQEVVLMLVPGVGRVVFDAEADSLRKDGRRVVRNELDLGTAAVSAARGYQTVFLVLKNETLVTLSFQIPGAEFVRLRDFARRVLAGIRD